MSKHPRAINPVECQACHKIIEIGQIIVRHHITYFPEKTIPVHKSCHSRIHVGRTMYQDLRPDYRDLLRWNKKKNGNYSHRTYLFDWEFPEFLDSIENGFWNEERIEREKNRQLINYWNECNRIKSIREKLNIKTNWDYSQIIYSNHL